MRTTPDSTRAALGLRAEQTRPIAESELLEKIILPPRPFDGEAASRAALRRIEGALIDHTEYRQGCLNLIASENLTSPAVRRLQNNDLGHRYGDYRGIDLNARKYLGNRHIVRIERYVTELVESLFGAAHADLRPLSGHIAGAAVLLALCKPGDTVLELDSAGGGHRLAEKLNIASLVDLKVLPLPFDAERFNLDVDRCRELVHRTRPRVVILGSSSFLFPHPVAPLREIVDQAPGTVLLYDASHVLGLIAGGCFQAPLKEGAHLVVASTHKTFGGPQGGLLMAADPGLGGQVADAIYPALVTNHHLQRLPALGAACLEWMRFGPAHAVAVVENAQAFAHELAKHGLEVVGNGESYTQSHTVLMGTRGYGKVARLARRLEEGGIIAGATVLPERWGRAGIRFGLQEVTRRGMTPAHAGEIAALIADIVTERRLAENCRTEVRAIASSLNLCRFGMD